jgi:hypothetical protein
MHKGERLMRSPVVAAVAALALVVGAASLGAQDFQEPKSKVAFSIDNGDLTLLGTGSVQGEAGVG